jgi:multidrug efflux pump subunit AcrA (membrane-fusion protein)
MSESAETPRPNEGEPSAEQPAVHDMPEGEEHAPRGVTVMAIVRWLLVLAMAVAAAASIGSYFGLHLGKTEASQAAVYYCPMHPSVTSDHPGECPICGMDLVLRDTGGGSASPGADLAMPAKKSHDGHRHEPTDPYVSPMHPEETSLEPNGRCPVCGMKMVPRAEVPEAVEIARRAAAAKAAGSGAPMPLDPKVPGLGPVDLSFERVQLIGVKTATVKKLRLGGELRTVGWVVAPEDGLSKVTARFAGWIETLSVSQTGQKVSRGQLLASAYSPQVVAAERELLTAKGLGAALAATDPAATGDAGMTGMSPLAPLGSLGDEARKRLEILGVPAGEIAAMEKDGKPRHTVGIYAPGAGYVVQKSAMVGQYVQPGTELFTVADLSKVWVVADVPEGELPRVKLGDAATFSLPSLEGKAFGGTIGFVYPSVDPTTRTARVRFEFVNPELALKPGMSGSVSLATATTETLLVPAEAIVDTGAIQYVFLKKPGAEGQFEPRRVRVGRREDGAVQVLEGLVDGDVVVTTGNFLLDSESRLRAAIEAPRALPAAPSTGGGSK